MPIAYRRGTPADTHAAYDVLVEAIADLAQRFNYRTDLRPGDPAGWEREQPIADHLTATADQFWLAELDGMLIGYARSILRDGVRELTEFFVLPRQQSAGVGRGLLARAFPAEGARHRSIIATSDIRALSRYLRAGVYPRFPIYFFERQPEAVDWGAGLRAEPIAALDSARAHLSQIDRAILGYERDVDHGWLLTRRSGFLYWRGAEVAGYGYTGPENGPFALLDPAHFPAVLAHAENLAAARGASQCGFEVPLINRAAVDYLLGRHYQMQPFFAHYLSDAPLGQLENYIVTSPPFIL